MCVYCMHTYTHTLIKIQADRRGEVNAPVSPGGPWRLRFLSHADAAGGNLGSCAALLGTRFSLRVEHARANAGRAEKGKERGE